LPHLDRFRALTEPGIVGVFTGCEITEIFANVPGMNSPQNVYTIAVLEEDDAAAPPALVNPTRLTVPGLRDWSFGICRYRLNLANFENGLSAFDATGVWALSGNPLGSPLLRQASPQFVPPDQATAIPLNKALKNNFWAGSHILEWADPAKALFKPIFDKPAVLAELAEVVLPFVPIDLAILSDRLGNMIVQIPVTVLTAMCAELRDDTGYYINVDWRPGTSPRPLRATVSAEHDETISGFVTGAVLDAPITLPLVSGGAVPKAYLLDEPRNILMAATGALSHISVIHFTTHIMGRAEPRTFDFQDRLGQAQSRSIALTAPKTEMEVGTPRQDPNGGFTQKRLYQLDTERVMLERLFEQYGLAGTEPAAENKRVLDDLVDLIRVHGETGAWLWDPFLEAVDVIETLFYSPHGGSDLRALSGADNLVGDNIEAFIARQRGIFSAVTGNLLGLRLDYRVAHSMDSIRFHDRFLIFPKDGGDLAWSLGTSINGLGKQHHILQKVDDGQRVSNAFQEMWNRMGPDQRIWSRP
jgi:hypothetical protein